MARYAFNELLSFVAGWAILLDFLILIAISTCPSGTIWVRSGGPTSTTRGLTSRSHCSSFWSPAQLPWKAPRGRRTSPCRWWI